MDTTLTNDPAHIKKCPRCHLDRVAYLRSMRRYDVHQRWFKCDFCDHLFTVTNEPGSTTAIALAEAHRDS
jgi:hypothetical protein